MDFCVRDDCTWLYPDSPLAGARAARLDAPRGGHAAFQLLLSAGEGACRLSFAWREAGGPPARLYRLREVGVNENTAPTLMTTTDYGACRDYVTRRAPFAVYDALLPCEPGRPAEGRAFWISVEVPPDQAPGRYCGALTLERGGQRAVCPVECRVYAAQVPAAGAGRLGMLNFFCYENIAAQHGAAEGTEAWRRLMRRYIRAQLEMRCTHILLPAGRPVRREGKLAGFDFSLAEEVGRIALEEGARWLCGGHVAHWSEWTGAEYYPFWDETLPVTGEEGYFQLRLYFSRWAEVVRKNGWQGRVAQALADEPQVHNTAAYRILAAVCRKFLPGAPIVDAVEATNLGGGVDVWVPKLDTWEKNKQAFRRLQAAGEEVWFYTCAFPAGRAANRSMDLPLTVSRGLLWLAAGERFSGYLHWGFNYYIGGDIWHSACCPPATPTSSTPAPTAPCAAPGTRPSGAARRTASCCISCKGATRRRPTPWHRRSAPPPPATRPAAKCCWPPAAACWSAWAEARRTKEEPKPPGPFTFGPGGFLCAGPRAWVRPAWPEQALRANIHAQISLALNRIFTEWYPSKGYNFNITNSTSYDQYYVHGRDIFEPMERITDDIFNTYVRRTGTIEPYYTEYCDGKSVTCAGMKQWGTVDRAGEGLNALQILRYYYGNNIEIVRTNNIQGIPQSYPGTALRRGDSGEAVRTIQRQLTRIAKNYPAFGDPGTDGVFGAATEASVKAFQKQFNLTADGVVGRSTWYKISYIYVSVKKLAELTSEGEKPTGSQDTITGSGYPGTALRRGDTGNSVEQVQFWLQQLSEFETGLPDLAVDGIFGAGTEAAVKAFQQKYGLTVDGVVGRMTWDAIWAEYQSLENDINSSDDGYPGTALRVGSRGDDVRKVQFWLRIAASNYSSIPAPAVDGIFGSGTEAAVKAFQREFGLTADGVVGPATWRKLYQVYADVTNQLLAPDQRPGTYPGSPLRLGSSGRAVREAQYYLVLMSAYYSSIPRIAIDGEFGTATQTAVKAFQKLFGLTQDGVIGPATWAKLYQQSQVLRGQDGLLLAYNLQPWPGFDLVEGAQGDNVAWLQFLLEYIGYFYDEVQSPGGIDGEFGPLTRASLESFQQEFGLPVTGVADETVWNALSATFISLAASGSEEAAAAAGPEYPGYVMALGSAGNAVMQLQLLMNQVAALYCAAEFVPVDGVYGTATEQAVRLFQEGLGLPVTGVVDRQTWQRIYQLLNDPVPGSCPCGQN